VSICRMLSFGWPEKFNIESSKHSDKMTGAFFFFFFSEYWWEPTKKHVDGELVTACSLWLSIPSGSNQSGNLLNYGWFVDLALKSCITLIPWGSTQSWALPVGSVFHSLLDSKISLVFALSQRLIFFHVVFIIITSSTVIQIATCFKTRS
jgi:hypothetical protein